MKTATLAPLVLDHVREYAPAKRRVRLREIWDSRRVLKMIALRDVTVKYKQSALGPLWLVFQPLGTLIAVTIGFSAVAGVDTGGVPYLLFALVGLTVWQFVQLALSASTNALIYNATLVRRSSVPRSPLVNAQLVSNLPPFAVVFTAAFLATLISRGFPLQVLLLPVMVIWLMLFCWGIVLIVASVSARFRDAVSAIPLIVQAGVFVSPVGYPPSAAGSAEPIVAANPVTGIIEGWRGCLLGGDADLLLIAIAAGWTVVLAVGGWWLFTRMEVRFADYI